jgi:hypothetical protein
MAQLKLTDSDLAAALVGFEFARGRIEAAIREIRQALGGGRSEPATSAEAGRPRKKRSAAVRRRMAQAQQARYAKLRQTTELPQAAKPKKRKLSAAGRKRIVEANEKRWAAVRAAKQAEKPAAGKKSAAKKTVVKKIAPRKAASAQRPTKKAKRVVAAKAKKVKESPEQPVAMGS